MLNVWGYTLGSVFIISLVSLVGVLTFSIRTEKLKQFLIYMISFSAGAIFGDAFIHLLPVAVVESGFTVKRSVFVLIGIGFSFVVEKFICWRHCHHLPTPDHPHPFAYMNLFGDFVHNFIDGLIIGASYLVSIPVGMATTLAVVLHEIPQEIGDFGVLLHGGFSKSKALMLNFSVSLSSVVGAIFALSLSGYVDGLILFLVPFAAGNFIYIAGADLIPELHKETQVSRSFLQFIYFVLGISVMMMLLLI